MGQLSGSSQAHSAGECYDCYFSMLPQRALTCVELAGADGLHGVLDTLPGPSIAGIRQQKVAFCTLYQAPVNIITIGIIT